MTSALWDDGFVLSSPCLGRGSMSQTPCPETCRTFPETCRTFPAPLALGNSRCVQHFCHFLSLHSCWSFALGVGVPKGFFVLVSGGPWDQPKKKGKELQERGAVLAVGWGHPALSPQILSALPWPSSAPPLLAGALELLIRGSKHLVR